MSLTQGAPVPPPETTELRLPGALAAPAGARGTRPFPGRPAARPPRLSGIAFGGDYNPEQWPAAVWDEDLRLMREAGVTLVTVGVFSWALLQPGPVTYRFDWLDQVMDRLDDAGIRVDLATPTAAPPAWFARRHPDSLPVTRDGQRLGIGAREAYCPSSVDYRDAAAGIAAQLAARYGAHPALALWHVGNEYGAHVPACYCERSACAFRRWLEQRYGALAHLNDAWGTAFWGQTYYDWAEVTPPRRAPMPVNPAQELDFLRFSCEEHLACFRAERDVLRELAPEVPVTTNFMVTNCKTMDYWQWAQEVDVVANDHYLQAEDPDNHVELAMSADLTRSLAGGRPWLLMEHSTGAVNWQPRNLAKEPGQMRRNSLTHVARGADSVLFFQWRASPSGAEKFHSAMLPHGGTRARAWTELTGLSRDLRSLAEVQGSTVRADVALVWDWQSWWALELDFRPSTDVTYLQAMRAFYAALWHAHVTVDFCPPDGDLSGYRAVVVPSLYATPLPAARNLHRYVEGGGQLLVSFFSGIVDEHDRVHPGGYPGAFRELLGLTVEEFHPLRREETVRFGGTRTGSVWSESVVPADAEAVLLFDTGPDAGSPAVTRRDLGAGTAWYLSTRPDADSLRAVLDPVLDAAHVPRPALPADLEAVRRNCDGTDYLFLINHGSAPVTVPASGTDLLTTSPDRGSVQVPAGGVTVVRSRPT